MVLAALADWVVQIKSVHINRSASSARLLTFGFVQPICPSTDAALLSGWRKPRLLPGLFRLCPVSGAFDKFPKPFLKTLHVVVTLQLARGVLEFVQLGFLFCHSPPIKMPPTRGGIRRPKIASTLLPALA